MNESKHQSFEFPTWLSLIPLGFGLLFILLMIYLGFISTEGARRHYQGKKIQKDIEGLNQIDFTPKMPVFPNDNRPVTPTPTPKPTPKPTPERSWRQKFSDYEIRLLLPLLPLLLVGLEFSGLAIGLLELKRKKPGYKNPLILKSFFAMVACITLSFPLLLLYIWALRMGLIG